MYFLMSKWLELLSAAESGVHCTRTWACRGWFALGQNSSKHLWSIELFCIWLWDCWKYQAIETCGWSTQKEKWLIRPKFISWVLILICLGVGRIEQKTLILEPSQRITARNALDHEYFKDIGLIPWPSLVQQHLSQDQVPQIVSIWSTQIWRWR
jgi:hypothetical protein